MPTADTLNAKIEARNLLDQAARLPAKSGQGVPPPHV